jgi:hypothetical protein
MISDFGLFTIDCPEVEVLLSSGLLLVVCTIILISAAVVGVGRIMLLTFVEQRFFCVDMY